MTQEWRELMDLTQGRSLIVERVRVRGGDIALEGQFELPSLASLSAGDQVFVAAFIQCHGSIKRMERFFGISYPTVKNRLNRIGEQLEFVEILPVEDLPPQKDAGDVVEQLDRGEISVDEALRRLRG